MKKKTRILVLIVFVICVVFFAVRTIVQIGGDLQMQRYPEVRSHTALFSVKGQEAFKHIWSGASLNRNVYSVYESKDFYAYVFEKKSKSGSLLQDLLVVDSSGISCSHFADWYSTIWESSQRELKLSTKRSKDIVSSIEFGYKGEDVRIFGNERYRLFEGLFTAFSCGYDNAACDIVSENKTFKRQPLPAGICFAKQSGGIYAILIFAKHESHIISKGEVLNLLSVDK